MERTRLKYQGEALIRNHANSFSCYGLYRDTWVIRKVERFIDGAAAGVKEQTYPNFCNLYELYGGTSVRLLWFLEIKMWVSELRRESVMKLTLILYVLTRFMQRRISSVNHIFLVKIYIHKYISTCMCCAVRSKNVRTVFALQNLCERLYTRILI